VTRAREPFKGKLAFPGGFVDYNEDPRDAVLRELAEECGIQAQNPQLVAVRGHPSRDPRQHVCTICYKVDAPVHAEPRAGDDAAAANWYSMETLLKSPEGRSRLAFDHAELLSELAAWLDQRNRR
jgi:8-oxo-dGTP diphosphatase